LPSTDSDNYGNNVEIASRLFAQHGAFIKAVIRSKIKDEAQADDIFQDFFLELASKSVPENVKNIKSYLYRAITNDTIDNIRRQRRYEAMVGRCNKRYDYSINKSGAEDALVLEEEVDKVLGIIERQLNGCESKAIGLRYGSSMSIDEIAETMQIKNRSVSRYISVGLKKVREFLTIETGD